MEELEWEEFKQKEYLYLSFEKYQMWNNIYYTTVEVQEWFINDYKPSDWEWKITIEYKIIKIKNPFN
jgi:hypothetical protein